MARLSRSGSLDSLTCASSYWRKIAILAGGQLGLGPQTTFRYGGTTETAEGTHRACVAKARNPRKKGDTLLNLALFLGGCVLLFFGAHWLVLGAASLAETLGIPKSVVGLTLVALGTSAPEMFVNFIAAAKGHTDIALTNVAGSNLANICIGFGLCALLGKLVIQRRQFATDINLLILTPGLVLAMFYVSSTRQLPYLSVLPLTGVLIFYLNSLRRRTAASVLEEVVPGNRWAAAGLFLLGVISLYGGGELVLRAALEAARWLGVSQDIVGLTIVAAGTSVPDIAASVIAGRRGEHGIAVGNLVGSNISNIVVVLNGTILVSHRGLPVTSQIQWDYVTVLLISLGFWAISMREQSMSKKVAILLLVVYFSYMAARVAMVVATRGAA